MTNQFDRQLENAVKEITKKNQLYLIGMGLMRKLEICEVKN